MPLVAADYPFLDVFWTILIFFSWVIWIWIAITIFADIFRRDDIGGWAKAGWIVFVIILPFLGVLVYLIAQHAEDHDDHRPNRSGREQPRLEFGSSERQEQARRR